MSPPSPSNVRPPKGVIQVLFLVVSGVGLGRWLTGYGHVILHTVTYGNSTLRRNRGIRGDLERMVSEQDMGSIIASVPTIDSTSQACQDTQLSLPEISGFFGSCWEVEMRQIHPLYI